jgi:hypothetical protein
MEPIAEDIVDDALEEIESFSDDRLDSEMAKLGEKQPDLLSFFVEFTQDLDEQVMEYGFYLFFAVYHIFCKGYGKKIRRIAVDDIITCFEDNQRLLESMEFAHNRFYERIAEVQISPQPYVIMFVVDALLEVPDEEADEELSDEDVGYLFLLLKTAIDVLNKKTG